MSSLWKLAIPNAAKFFFWRACHDVLPTKENLLQGKVVKEPFCPICEPELETVLHALWACPAAKDIWGSGKRIFQKMTTVEGSFIKTAEHIFSKCDLPDFALFVQLSRQVWLRRNKWVHEGIFVDPNVILQKTEEETIAYAQVFHKNQAGKTEPNRVQAWRAPNHGWHKANWDVAIDKAKSRVGIRVVIRDESGQVVAALCRTRMGILEPAIGEAYAAFQAVCLCRDLGVQRVILEGDAKQIVEAIQNETCLWSRFGHLIEDTRRILLSLSRWNCVFIPREANEAAHRMAKAATIDINDRIWRDTTPNCISDIILMEQLALSR